MVRVRETGVASDPFLPRGGRGAIGWQMNKAAFGPAGRADRQMTNDDPRSMTLDIARQVLRDERADAGRVAWAEDVIAALERGDREAAERVFIPTEWLPETDERKAA